MANESWQLENHGDYNETNFFSRKWEFRNSVLQAILLDKKPSGVCLLQQLYGSYYAWPTRKWLGRRQCNLLFETEGVYHFITVSGLKLRSSLAVPSLPWRYCRKRSSDSQNLPTREIVSDQQASARQSTAPHSIPTQLSQLNYPWYSVLNSFLMICLSLRYDVDEIDDGTWETKLMLSIILVFPLSLSADGKQRRNVLQYLKRNGTVHQQTCLDLATLHIISWCVTWQQQSGRGQRQQTQIFVLS